jgi:hypothetical protein
MNRSYSKIRHIQEMNQRMDNKLIEEKITNSSVGFISEQGEKKTFLNLLEKQRLIEEKLKYGGTKNFILEQQEEDPEGEEDLSGIPDLESDEDYDAIIAYYLEEYNEYLRTTFKDFIGDEDEGETLTESDQRLLIEADLLLEYCPQDIGDCFRNLGKKFKKTKFARWFRKNIGEPASDAMENFGRKVKKGFKKFMKNVKGIDLNIEHKKRRKKGKKYKRKNSRRLKSLDREWYSNKKGTIRIGRVGWLTFGKGRGSSSEEFSSEEEMDPSIDEENYASYLKENESKMVSLMSKTSQANWAALKADPEEIGYAVAVLERFNKTYEEKNWKKVGVGLDQETFIKECENDPIINNIPADEKLYPTATFEFPLSPENDKNLFKNNQWNEAYAEIFVQEIKDLCAIIQKQMSGLTPPEGKPKAFLEAMYIQASASRLRNGGLAESLSFKQLSEKRLETAKAILTRELAAIGVLINTETKYYFDTDAKPTDTNPMGNGDGSSGPNPPIGKGFIAKGNFPMSPNCGASDQSCTLNGKTVLRTECGTPHTNELEYDKYKFINGSVKLIFNDDYTPEPDVTPSDEKEKKFEPEVEVIETDVYPIYFYAPGKKPFKIPIPGLRIKWKQLFKFKKRIRPTYGPDPSKKNGATRCEFFGETK